MEDNYLDKVFQDKLESSQHFDFDEAAWDNLAARLDDKPTRRVIPWQWFAAAGIVLPLLLSSVYLFFQLKQTEKAVAKLEAQVDNLAENIPAKKIHENTSFTNEVTNEATTTKTIENTTISLKNETKKIAKNAIVAISKTVNEQKKLLSNTVITNRKEIHKENKEIENTEATIAYGEAATYLNKIVYTSAATTKRNTNNKGLENWIRKEKVLEVKKSNWDKAKIAFIPVGFELGLGYQSGVTIAKNLTMEQKPYFNSKGVRGAINFVNNVDLTLAANHVATTYESKTIEQDFPHVIPNNPTDIFQKVVVSKEYIQIPVGLKYNFGNYNALFSPFIEIGAIAKKAVQQNHRYEYKPATPGNEFYAVIPKPEPITESLEMNTLTGAVGVTWNPTTKLLDNIVLQTEVFTATDIEDMNAPVTMVGVGVSAKYMF